MTTEIKSHFIDAGTLESEEYQPSDEVRLEFEEAARLGQSGERRFNDHLNQYHETSPELAGGDLDAAWEAADVGEELVGGENPTPDQSVVEELGRAVGIVYADAEPLKSTDKIADRDQHRWELDPASSEGFEGRSRHEGEYAEQ
jgi:hypothetical protein